MPEAVRRHTEVRMEEYLMKWKETEPKQGDIVRVKLQFYYHYGLYDDAQHVIAFGLPDNSGIPRDEIAVVATDVQTFLHGGNIETAQLSLGERLKRHSVSETLRMAYDRVGETGYHLLKNNCEHFVNECVFGVHKSDMADPLAERLLSNGK